MDRLLRVFDVIGGAVKVEGGGEGIDVGGVVDDFAVYIGGEHVGGAVEFCCYDGFINGESFEYESAAGVVKGWEDGDIGDSECIVDIS